MRSIDVKAHPGVSAQRSDMTVNDGPCIGQHRALGEAIGRSGPPIIRDPTTPTPGNVVLLESTYGDRDHRPLDETRDQRIGDLCRSAGDWGQGADSCRLCAGADAGHRVSHRGVVEIGKAQERERVRGQPGWRRRCRTSTSGTRKCSDERATELREEHVGALLSGADGHAGSVEESKRLNGAVGCMVIIAASGRAMEAHHASTSTTAFFQSKTHVVIVGYQVIGTLGRQLVDGGSRVTIFP